MKLFKRLKNFLFPRQTTLSEAKTIFFTKKDVFEINGKGESKKISQRIEIYPKKEKQ